MAGIGDKWEIDKLNESNWSTWKFQMKHLLIAKEVWEHVDGTVQPPGEDAAAPARHVKAQQKAMATLVMGINPNLIYLVTSCNAPKEVWDTLKAQFERNTLANKLLLKRQYFTTKMREGQSVQDHLRCMKEISDKLAALGSPVAEEEQVVALLISLPASYSTLVTAMEAKGDDLSLVFVQQSLVSEEQKRQVNESSIAAEDSKTSALWAKTHRPFKGRCYKCNREGHKSAECRETKPTKSYKPSKHKSGFHGAKIADQDDEQDQDLGSGLFIMATGQNWKKTSQHWLLDSGAS